MLDVGEVLSKRVGVNDVRCLDTVQDHVHDPDDVSKRLFLLAVEGLLLKLLELGSCQLLVTVAHVVVRLAKKARRTTGAVVDRFANLRVSNLDHCTDERPRRIVFAAVASGVAHVPYLDFV